MEKNWEEGQLQYCVNTKCTIDLKVYKIKGWVGEIKDTMSRFENEGEGVVVQWTLNYFFFRILYFNNDMENMQNVILNHVFNFVIVIKDRNAAYVTVQSNAVAQQT